MFFRLVSLFILFVITTTAQAEILRIGLGSDMIRINYASANLGKSIGQVEFEAGLLYSEQNATSDTMGHIGALVRGESVEAPIVVSVGVRGYFGSADSQSVGGLAIGGEVTLSPESWNGFGLGGMLYFAPSVVSYGEAKGLQDYGVNASFKVTNQSKIILGYQIMKVDFDSLPTRTVDDGAYIGIDINF
jgi:hypothetical protein